MNKQLKPFVSKWAPFAPHWISGEAATLLPRSVDEVPTREDVAAFIAAVRDRPDLEIEVKAALRQRAVVGAEVPLAILALALAATTASLSSLAAQGVLGAWIAAVVGGTAVIAGIPYVRMAAVAHLRRAAAVSWLGAYEDALSAHRTRRGWARVNLRARIRRS